LDPGWIKIEVRNKHTGSAPLLVQGVVSKLSFMLMMYQGGREILNKYRGPLNHPGKYDYFNEKLVTKVTKSLPYFLLAEWMVASPGVSSHSLFSSIAASTRLAAKIR
jgi:hypothetical protein